MRTHRRVRAAGLLSVALAATTLSSAPALAAPPSVQSVPEAAVAALPSGGNGAGAKSKDRCPQLKLADNWYGDNAELIQSAIDKAGRCSWPGGRAPQVRPYAVFDWDNTVIKNDISDQTIFWMLGHDKILQPPGRNWHNTSRFMTVAGAQALRKAFAARGLSGGKEVTLAELRLALGCKGTTPKCLARGGSVVGARRLVYGTLHRDASTWALEVTLVEVDGGATTSASLVLTNAELAADRIGHVAEEVADRLAPDTVAATTPGQGTGGLAEPSPAPSPAPAEPDDEADPGKGEGKLRFGYERSQSRWKWIGFGVSAGVAAGTGAATLGLSVWLTSKNGGFRAQLIDAANASLTDANPLNDVDPNLPEGVNLCDYAREQTDPTQPDRVRNASVTNVCMRGDTQRKRMIITGITSGIALAATLGFTIALLVHREPARSSAWRRHRMQVGLDPAERGQGLSLGVGGQF